MDFVTFDKMDEISLLPSAGSPTKETRETGKEKTSSSCKKCFLVVFVLTVFLVGGVLAAYLVIFKNEEDASYCRKYLENPLEDPFLSQICQFIACNFDVSLCNLECPAGNEEGDDSCPVSCLCAAESRSFQGDIQFQEEDLPMLLQQYGLLDDEGEGFSLYVSISTEILLWIDYLVDGRYKVPYDFRGRIFDEKALEYFASEIQTISSSTCIDFVQRTTEEFFLNIISGALCSSVQGRQYSKRHPLSIPERYHQPNTMVHELMHALGFPHEQSRVDRDDYITIHDERIHFRGKSNFHRLIKEHAYDLGVPFDYESVMLFDGLAFSADGLPSITRNDNGEPTRMGSFSELDAEDIRRLYKCSGTFPTIQPLTATLPPPPEDNWNPLQPSSDVDARPSGSQRRVYEWAEWNPWTACTRCNQYSISERSCLGAHQSFCRAFRRRPNRNYERFRHCRRVLSECKGNGTHEWNRWSSWSNCVGTSRNRSRTCPGYCVGHRRETRKCGDYTWLEWGQWTGCSFCDPQGKLQRTRQCSLRNSLACKELAPYTSYIEEKSCVNLPVCKDTVLFWGRWLRWSACTTQCGPGTRTRERVCLGKGTGCPGSSSETTSCGNEACGLEHTWLDWGYFNSATACTSCAKKNYATRKRSCRAGTVTDCQAKSPGSQATEQLPCSLILKCTDKGKREKPKFSWLSWSPWTGCENCALDGVARRERKCSGGTQQECLYYYKTKVNDTRSCSAFRCVSGVWEQWGQWRQCSKTCERGMRMRYRTCNQRGRCEGSSYGVELCNMGECKETPRWAEWKDITPCFATCGSLAVKLRRRSCLPEGAACKGPPIKIERCTIQGCAADDELSDEDVATVFSQTGVKPAEGVCETALSWVFGDFNGDRYVDIMCGMDTSTFEVRLSEGSTIGADVAWDGKMQDCSGETKLADDFNADGLDDLICQDKSNKKLTLKLSDSGKFSAPATLTNSFCVGDEDELLIVDVDGDSDADLLCNHANTGEIEVYVVII